MTIEQLGPDGAYATATASRFLHVRPDEVTRWLADGLDADRRDWVPAVARVGPRRAMAAGRRQRGLTTSLHRR